MSEILAKVKSWGNSLGIIIPSDIVKKDGIKPDDDVIVRIEKKHDIEDLFGSLKGLKIDAQKMKDDSRKMWNK